MKGFNARSDRVQLGCFCKWCAEHNGFLQIIREKSKAFRYISSCVAGLFPVLLGLSETVVFGIKHPCQLL